MRLVYLLALALQLGGCVDLSQFCFPVCPVRAVEDDECRYEPKGPEGRLPPACYREEEQ